MPTEVIAEWVFRGLMVLTSVSVFLWGRASKQTEELLQAREDLRNQRIAELERLIKAISIGETVTETKLRSQLEEAVRLASHKARNLIQQDLLEHLRKIDLKIEDAKRHSSETWSRVQARIGELEIQVTRIETRQEERS